ncbi:MAG TPA: hypothetical protein VFB38_19030 [Chthonomonadaceae bacterium]|nr:hypothetical protein [Chthonomonadaceae bacterium]
MFPRKAKRWLLAAILIGVVAAWGILSLRPKETPLLPHARRVAAINGAYPFYWWVSEQEFLYFRDPARQDWTLVRRNLKTGNETPLAALTQLFRTSGGKPETAQISPEGTWLLWTGARGDTFVSTLDGSRHFQTPSHGPAEKRWLLDGFRWVEILNDGTDFSQAIFHTVDSPKELKYKPITPLLPSDPNTLNVSSMMITPDGHLMTNFWNGGAGKIGPARVIAADFTASPSRIGKFVLPAPHECDRGDLVFSPTGDYAVWVLEYGQPLAALLGGRKTTGFWVIGRDSLASYELGSVETARDGRSGPLAVRWLPDGAHISFVYNNALWVIPAYGKQE